jgi:hypothetical protein
MNRTRLAFPLSCGVPSTWILLSHSDYVWQGSCLACDSVKLGSLTDARAEKDATIPVIISPRDGEEKMPVKELTAEQAIDELAEGVAIQAELVGHRMTLEWGQKLFTQLVSTWTTLEQCEALAYEDKVAVQMRVLDEATASLWHLHKRLLQANRMLKTHRKHLGRLKNPLIF